MAERSRRFLFLLLAVLTRSQWVQGAFRDCNNSLGMENGHIPDSNIVATVNSYQNSPMFGAHRARLNSLSGYRADPSALSKDRSAYIWVQLPKPMIIAAVATQGLEGEWVTKYEMFFTSDDATYVYFRDFDTFVKEFEGNVDGNTVKFNTVPYPNKTSQVLLFPTQWHKNIALRFELYGCEPVHYFKIWLKVLETPFALNYMDLNDENTKYSEELVVNEVKEYLKDVPGFIFAKLHQFSPPFFIYKHQIDQTSMTAEMEIHCIESTTLKIFGQLQNSLVNQGNTPVFGNTILHVQKPANVKCQPPAMRISNISKHPFNTQVVLHDESNVTDKFIILTSSLAPDCNISKMFVYSWEIASVDTDTGMFNQIFQFGNADRRTNKTTKGKFWKILINPPGLQYVRCIARVDVQTGIRLLTYDFGFFKLVRKRPLDCKVSSRQGMASFIKFTLQCKNGYKGIQASGYTFTGLDSRSNILARSEWRSPNGTITLPVTDVSPMENYSIRVQVEAKYFSIPSLFLELLIMESLECEIMSSQRMPTFEKFTLHCEGGYKDVQAISYVATALNSSNQILNSSKWGSSNGSVNLPAGDGYGMEGYNVRVKVEAKYLSLPSLFDDVAVKVNILGKEVSSVLNLLAAGKYDEAAHRLPNLQNILHRTKLDNILSKKIKVNVTRGMLSMNINSVRQLNEVARFVIFCNKIKEETTPEIQENSLRILNMAVSFLKEKSAGKIANISSITESLLEGVAVILASVWEVEITKLAAKTVHDISDMRRRFQRFATDEDEVRLHSNHGISVLLAKTKIQPLGEKVFHIRGDEVRLPEGLFTGEWGEAFQSGSVQIIRYERNPYFRKQGILPRNVSALDITFWDKNETRMKISNLSTPIRVVFSRNSQETSDQDVPGENLFLKRNDMRYHPVFVPHYAAVVTVRIKPEKNVSLRVYVRYDSRPTAKQHDFNVTLPNTAFPSCLSITDGWNSSCSPRDPYEFDLLPNVTSHIGNHTIGVEILEHLTNIKDNGRKIDELASRRKRQSCVKVKPAPPTPPSVKQHKPRQFNSTTDVKYKMFVTVGTCVFWDEMREKWSARGCQVHPVSNETNLHCLTNHLSTFSGNFFVAPNEIDFDEVLITRLPPENMVVLFTVCLIFLVYAVGLVFARRADNRDKMKVVNTKGSSQKQEHCSYNYEVSIQTGMWYENGTTANVGIILFGEEEISGTVFFRDPWKESKLFTRGSVNNFTFDLPSYLGQLYKIRIWHDNSGTSPAWFLYEVAVRDVSTGEKWHFVANRWLAVESLDGAIDVEVKAATKRELTRFSNLLQWRAVTSFADRHLFLSIFARPPQNPFTRCQRLTCMLSIILVSLVTNAMFYRSKKTNDPNSVQIGPLELSLTQIIIGVQSGLIALPVNIITVMIFRNIKRNPSPDSSKEMEVSPPQRKPTQGFLPPCFVVIGWFICLSASIASAIFAIFYSLQWGAEKANRWLLSVGVSLLQDILLTGPIIILLNTTIVSFVNRKPTVNNEIKEVAQQANLVHIVQENDEVTSHKPSAEELQTARSLRLRQRKLRRFFADLLLYVTFVVLLMTVCYANRKPSMFRLTKALKDTFGGFYQVNDASSFWAWFEEELVPGIYDNGQSADGNETGIISSKIGFIVGLPRIRQIRIRPESTCKVFQVETVLRTHFNRCLSDNSYSNKDTTPNYEPGWKPYISRNSHEHHDSCPEPWRYEDPMSVREMFLPYGGGGYVAKLGYDAATALIVKESLEENSWIDEMSAAVIVQFVVFEPANLLLSDVMLLLEKFPSGMRRTSIDVVPEYIFPSSGSAVRTFYRVSILLWFITILVLLFIEIVRCFKHRRAYFKKFFSWVSMLQILSSSCAVLIVFVKENSLKNFLKRIRDNPFGDWSAYELVGWSSFQEFILSIAVVTTTINCLKLIQLNRHVHVMKWTLQSAYRYLCSFSVVVMMLALAFAQLGTLLFGQADEEYATLYYALRTVLKMAIGVGKIQFTKMSGGSGESEVFAPIFLMGCMLSMTIIFVNTFIAILDDAFHQAKGKEYSGEELGPYLKSCLIKHIRETNSISVKRVFRKSPFRRSIRRKYRIQPPKRKLQRPKEDFAAPQKERPRLAESESLSSYESISLHEGFESITNTQTTQASHADRKIEGVGMEVLHTKCGGESDKEMLNNQEFYLDASPSEEENLLSDVAKIIKTIRSDFTKCLWEDEEWYNSREDEEWHKSRSSCSSRGDSFADMNESPSILNLVQPCKEVVSNNQTWSYIRSMEKNQDKRIYRTIVKRQIYTEVLGESFV